MPTDVHPFLGWQVTATNAHDLDALVDCFTPEGSRDGTAAHPPSAFDGREQVRSNWRQIFAFVPEAPAGWWTQLSTGTRSGPNGR